MTSSSFSFIHKALSSLLDCTLMRYATENDRATYFVSVTHLLTWDEYSKQCKTEEQAMQLFDSITAKNYNKLLHREDLYD